MEFLDVSKWRQLQRRVGRCLSPFQTLCGMRRVLRVVLSTLAAWAVVLTLEVEASLHQQEVSPASPKTSELCTEEDTIAFATDIQREQRDCALIASYDWGSETLPTQTQQRQLCGCTALISKLQGLKLPRCELLKNGKRVTYAWLVQYTFQICSTNGTSVTPTTTPTPTTDQPATPEPPKRLTPIMNKPTTPTATTVPTESNSTDAPVTQNATDSASSPSNNSHQPTVGEIQDSSSKAATISGIIAGVLSVALIAALFVRGRTKSTNGGGNAIRDHDMEAAPPSPLNQSVSTEYRSPKATRYFSVSPSSTPSMNTSAPSTKPRYHSALWEDSAITALRIPHDAISLGSLIGLDGRSQVYLGTFNSQPVAIKQLSLKKRKDAQALDAFLTEAKLLSTLTHERIAHFIGITCLTASDMCMVVEYLPNGDLRSVLNRWEHDPRERRAHGFDVDKIKIALHVAHTVMYLHSCKAVPLHCDLKSSKILLDDNHDAKLTVFGVSRERTALRYGASLWMAPEVMVGGRCDEKADVYSFGVLLSELDTHATPYAHAIDSLMGSAKLAETEVLRMVSLGQLAVEFSAQVDREPSASRRSSRRMSIGANIGGPSTASIDVDVELARLGRVCVSLDPRQRPTTGQVLQRVHQVWRALA